MAECQWLHSMVQPDTKFSPNKFLTTNVIYRIQNPKSYDPLIVSIPKFHFGVPKYRSETTKIFVNVFRHHINDQISLRICNKKFS